MHVTSPVTRHQFWTKQYLSFPMVTIKPLRRRNLEKSQGKQVETLEITIFSACANLQLLILKNGLEKYIFQLSKLLNYPHSRELLANNSYNLSKDQSSLNTQTYVFFQPKSHSSLAELHITGLLSFKVP